MSKSGKKSEGSDTHIAKADVRHRYEVTEFADFTRRETKSDGTEQLMPRVAVLTPVGGGKQVRAYMPGNLDEPVVIGCIVMCRPYEQKGKNDGPPVKFRVTNVLESRGAQSDAGDVFTATQNAQAGTGVGTAAPGGAAKREAAVRKM